jgi:hypothetical protein
VRGSAFAPTLLNRFHDCIALLLRQRVHGNMPLRKSGGSRSRQAYVMPGSSNLAMSLPPVVAINSIVFYDAQFASPWRHVQCPLCRIKARHSALPVFGFTPSVATRNNGSHRFLVFISNQDRLFVFISNQVQLFVFISYALYFVLLHFFRLMFVIVGRPPHAVVINVESSSNGHVILDV